MTILSVDTEPKDMDLCNAIEKVYSCLFTLVLLFSCTKTEQQITPDKQQLPRLTADHDNPERKSVCRPYYQAVVCLQTEVLGGT